MVRQKINLFFIWAHILLDKKQLFSLLIILQFLFYSFLGWAACPGNLDDTINTPVFNYQESYTNDNTDPDFFSNTNANRVSDALDDHHQSFTDLGFLAPFFNTDPAEVCCYDSSNIGGADFCRISLDTPYLQPQAEPCLRLVTGHELFHHVQYAYINNGSTGCGSCGGTWGKWTCEGTARLMQDKIYTDLDQNGGCITYLDEINDYLSNPNITLTSASYKAALFWNYLTEQFGSILSEPERGVDVIESYWNNTDPDNPDAMEVLRDTLHGFEPGLSLEKVFQDFSITNYTKNFDLSSISDSHQYFYIDETLSGGGTVYDQVSRSSVGFSNSLSSSSVNAWASQYFEVDVDSSGECEIIGFRGEASDNDADISWTVIGIKAPDRVVELHKGRGNSFYKAFINNPSDPFIKIAAVVTGLSEGGSFDYVFGSGAAKMVIKRPTFSRQAYVGEHADPDRFQVRLEVNGPSVITPGGTGSISVKGLSKENFTVFVKNSSIGYSEEAPVLTGAYVGGQYWLSVQAPVADASQAFYDLRVCLCEVEAGECGIQSTQRNAIVYAKLVRNQMLVIDRSGSMTLPSATPKIDAAKAAANIFVDAAADLDKLGVISFTGDLNECNDDAELRHDLQEVNDVSRIDAKDEINNISAGGWTGIGDGMVRAQDRLDAQGIPSAVDHIVLLSDGMENEARCWDSTVPNCSNGPSPCDDDVKPIFTTGPGSDTIIDTIAFGPQTDQNLMQDIAAAGTGDYYYVDVTDTSASVSAKSSLFGMTIGNRISDVYLSINDSIQKKDRIFFATGMTGGMVNQVIHIDEGKLSMAVFAFSWENPGAVAYVKLFDPNGNAIGPGDAQIFQDQTHVVYQFPGIVPGGSWQAEIVADESTHYMVAVSGKFTQGVQADLYFSQAPSQDNCRISAQFLAGLPMTVLVSLADGRGEVLNADVLAKISTPDGQLFSLPLFDDGQHDDGDADDGVYGNVFTRTASFSQQGVSEREAEKNPGTRGSYIVSVVAQGISNQKEKFTRLLNRAFQVFECYSDINPDADYDGMPDRFEWRYSCLDPSIKDADKDPDNDGLSSGAEFKLGTNPCDPDTDNGGEIDGSEVNRNADPLDPADDLLPRPFDAEVITTLGDEDPTPLLFSRTNTIRYPSHAAYRMLILFRGISPKRLIQVAEIDPKSAKMPGIYLDEGLVNGQQYFYQLIAVGEYESRSVPGPIFTGTPKEDPIPPKGWVTINRGTISATGPIVKLTFDTEPDDAFIRVANNTPLFGSEPFTRFATDWMENPGEMEWELEPNENGYATVYVQYMDKAGNISVTYHDSIIVDPDEDLDNDKVKDEQDNCPMRFNPDQDDRDEDQVGDVCDNCPDTFNPDQRDSDFNGIGNACDCAGGDRDRDGDSDGQDVSLLIQNLTGNLYELRGFAAGFGKIGCFTPQDAR